MHLRRGWIVVLAVAMLTIAGCGGGGGGDSSESTDAGGEAASGALTKAGLIERGDAICAEVNAAVAAIDPESPGATARIAGIYSGMVKSLKSLGNPTETEGKYGEYLRTLDEVEAMEKGLKLTATTDSPELASMKKGAAGALGDFQFASGEYGFKECSQGPGAPK
jgi:hypothetical protein